MGEAVLETRSANAFRQVRGLVHIVRPLNVVMMAVGVGVGGVLAGGSAALAGEAGRSLLLAATSAVAIGAGANALNDIHDLEIDRVNRPHRPLPAGMVSVQTARAAWAALSAVGGVLATLLSLGHLAVAVLSVGLLAAYSARLKRRPLVGNIAVALVLALALPYGGWAVLLEGPGQTGPLVLGAAFAFGSTLARELAKDIEDTAGDAAGGAATLPLAVGVPAAAWVSAGAALATVAALPFGHAAGLSAAFLGLALPAGTLLLAAAWAVLGAREEEPPEAARRAGHASALFKVAMVAGLAALAVAAW